MPKASAISNMFGEIAPRYDLANHLLSGGACRWWTHRLVREVQSILPAKSTVADLATGSGDVAFALARALPDATVLGFDFCEPMLDVARKHLTDTCAAPFRSRLHFAYGDCMALPLETDSVDAVTIAYGIRNFQDRQCGLREMLRVLRPGGSLFTLEFSQPLAFLRPAYYLYLRHCLPWIARLATGHKDAYDYLVSSIAQFPDKEAIAAELRSAGFVSARAIGLTAGIVAIHHAQKAVS
ncbi:MAG: ubiquinone/menaquinone biosynthesis methyltransferase [Puniceicoccales bacterium]|jgi:demethylmenaquinone methyltransferase/2-methoxy-6-polyprenyl-1,4-benzoquinol methylase|nr:ubiquinone/menaquinone biosynthesis methyltransferase [Puniceicoccales bacterium]